jgi:hypothetical protein
MLGTIFTIVRTAIKVVGFVDAILDEAEHEKKRDEKAAKDASRKVVHDHFESRH